MASAAEAHGGLIVTDGAPSKALQFLLDHGIVTQRDDIVACASSTMVTITQLGDAVDVMVERVENGDTHGDNATTFELRQALRSQGWTCSESPDVALRTMAKNNCKQYFKLLLIPTSKDQLEQLKGICHRQIGAYASYYACGMTAISVGESMADMPSGRTAGFYSDLTKYFKGLGP